MSFGVSPVNYSDSDSDTVINDWAKYWTKRVSLTLSFWTLKKSFDTPLHELLKSKLFSYGICGN